MDVKKSELNAYLEPVAEADITPEHRAWMDARVHEAMDRKTSGQATYKSLDDICRKYDL